MDMKISLITCVYNSEKYLETCLQSIQKQSFKDFELIIINDGSNDGSKKIIEKYVNDNSNFYLYDQDNKGQAVARNRGIELAKGEYIVFVDSDDELLENYLLNLSKAISNKVDLGFSRVRRIFEKKPNILEKKFKYIHTYEGNKTSIYDDPSILIKITNAPYAKIIRRQFLLDNKIKFYPNRLYEDLLFTQSILLSNPRLMYIDDDSYLYYVHSGTSMTGNGKRAFEMLDVFDSVLQFAKSKGIDKTFFFELEYLSIYHVAIGTLYRYFCYKPTMFIYALKRCRKYLKDHSFSTKNKYLNEFSLFTRLFLRVFYS